MDLLDLDVSQVQSLKVACFNESFFPDLSQISSYLQGFKYRKSLDSLLARPRKKEGIAGDLQELTLKIGWSGIFQSHGTSAKLCGAMLRIPSKMNRNGKLIKRKYNKKKKFRVPPAVYQQGAHFLGARAQIQDSWVFSSSVQNFCSTSTEYNHALC
jgi:hypothetical protein